MNSDPGPLQKMSGGLCVPIASALWKAKTRILSGLDTRQTQGHKDIRAIRVVLCHCHMCTSYTVTHTYTVRMGRGRGQVREK